MDPKKKKGALQRPSHSMHTNRNHINEMHPMVLTYPYPWMVELGAPDCCLEWQVTTTPCIFI